ncbi:MAG: hypothetical protein PWP07_1205 [Epulopiscium sp.]|jgi:uncharacterized protein YabE (DUF348 family)|uniref:DUF348 domain-containing protein n=1 Tax=Defluviitalea raffinosedens TaxID=1450156 RepID=A0A7C8HGI9_9FIRM|nr:3D domain-containing protein [Defluviitalea raffinosedens]MBZ4667690.1 hypothetical protein [Defluviitaleaceae bacterium]MDK2787980.1 hypothetical protein [Candidatus Epulonipiscium sp.]KAE9628754.1 DUF348 domain-containing protein [Defluviitalea raffinosedens]MBM7686842.1 uncharacterized protein YabE (DUF348 family) [Defluviitalea raffinosedens]HHW66115.1 DUF348 domain-containing protein [Candidatus Epulonipiscium sp.]
MNQKTRTLLLIIGMFLLGSSSVTAYQLMLKEVTVIDNDKLTLYKTPKTTVESFLQEQSITLSENDEMDVDPDDQIVEGMTITIHRAVPVEVTVDGKEKEVYTKTKTIEDFLEEQNIELGSKGNTNIPLEERIRPYMELEIQTYKEEFITEKAEIPYKTQTKETTNLPAGEKKVVQHGKKGILEKTIKIEYLGGKEQKREVVAEIVLSEPQDEIIEVGAQNTIKGSDGKIYKYKKVLTMNATAYTASYKDTGKYPGQPGFGITYTGTRARVGTVAVDPKVIPLGTKLYVEGYGYAVAEDIGGAIKGNKIDLYFNTLEEAVNFGRQQRKVYILAEQ